MKNSTLTIKQITTLPLPESPSQQERRPPTPSMNSKIQNHHHYRCNTPPPSPRPLGMQRSRSDDDDSSLGSYKDDALQSTNPQSLPDEFDIFKSKGSEDGLFGLAFLS